jgi:hypothetical protein
VRSGEERRSTERRRGLGQVVVSAQVQSHDALLWSPASREHNDRCGVASGAELGKDGKAVQLRQHDIQDDGIVGVLRCQLQRRFPVVGDINAVALLLQPVLEEGG